jgi:hypothetical protein
MWLLLKTIGLVGATGLSDADNIIVYKEAHSCCTWQDAEPNIPGHWCPDQLVQEQVPGDGPAASHEG